jgi:hypothetical protein
MMLPQRSQSRMLRDLPSVQTLKQHPKRPRPKEKHWKKGIARSKQVARTEPRKRLKLANEPKLRHIPLSGMQLPVRWATLEGTRFPIADFSQQLRHADRVVLHSTGPTLSATSSEGEEWLEDRILKLEQVVEQLKAAMRNRTNLVEEERIAKIEHEEQVKSERPSWRKG